MPDKRIPGDRKQKRRKSAARAGPGPKLTRHPLFGNIPFIKRQTEGGNGKTYEWWQHDPDYQPPMPPGAVRGDVHKQIYCTAHHVPKYFYLDETHTCIQCGREFVFRAGEQKYWYETLKFNFASVPIRCPECRRERRSEHALREQIGRARADVRENNPAAHLALARAIIEYHERTQHGDLNEAIASARKAKELWPDSVEPSVWEGIAQALAGRNAKARAALNSFLSESTNTPAALRNKAQKYLQQLA